jgi:Fe-S cluster biogenesis protein NfuA
VLLDEVQARERVVEVEARLAELEALPDRVSREVAVGAVQALMDLYGAGLARMLELAPEICPRVADDELVAHLLLLHGLHPVALETRVEAALESVRPYLAMHGGNVELVSVRDAVAVVKLQGTCHGCPSSTATLKQAIEEAVFKAAPDLDRVQAEGVAAPNLIALDDLTCPLPAISRV